MTAHEWVEDEWMDTDVLALHCKLCGVLTMAVSPRDIGLREGLVPHSPFPTCEDYSPGPSSRKQDNPLLKQDPLHEPLPEALWCARVPNVQSGVWSHKIEAYESSWGAGGSGTKYVRQDAVDKLVRSAVGDALKKAIDNLELLRQVHGS